MIKSETVANSPSQLNSLSTIPSYNLMNTFNISNTITSHTESNIDIDSSRNTVYEGVVVVSDELAAMLDDLEPWTNYSLKVSAATVAGVGVASEPIVCSTQEDGLFKDFVK